MTTSILSMKDFTIGTLVKVNDSTARNPGGYGRVTRREPKKNLIHVDSSEFPGQEVTGWYPIGNVELYTPITDLKRIEHVIDRSSGRPQSEYWGYYDDQLIGVKSTNSACEKMLDEYAYDLLVDSRPIPRCDDCGTTFNDYGQCETCIEANSSPIPPDESKPVPLAKHLYVIYDATIRRFICRWRQNDDDSGGHTSYPDFASCQKWADWIHFPIIYFGPAELAPDYARPTPRIFCRCGQPALIEEPHGTFCGACYVEEDDLDMIAGDVGGVVAYVNGRRTIVAPGDY